MDLQQISKIVEILNQILTALAIVVGGIWAYWNFVLKRTGVWNLQLTIVPQVIPYLKDKRLLVINVTLKNVGKVKITPGPSGCRVSVRKLSRNLGLGKQLEWKEAKKIIDSVDVLRHYRDGGREYSNYEIEPNCEYHELETLVVSKGDLLNIEVKFWWKKDIDAISENCIFSVS